MHRRQLIAASSLAFLMPAVIHSGEGSRVDDSPETYSRLIASGKPFMLDFYAP